MRRNIRPLIPKDKEEASKIVNWILHLEGKFTLKFLETNKKDPVSDNSLYPTYKELYKHSPEMARKALIKAYQRTENISLGGKTV
jgi:hypothetical protein